MGGNTRILKNCPSNVDLSDMIEDLVDESVDTLEGVDMNDNAEVLEELANIDDLLESDSDEELF